MRAKNRSEAEASARIKGGSVRREPMNVFDRFVTRHKTLSATIFVVVVVGGGIWALTYQPWH